VSIDPKNKQKFRVPMDTQNYKMSLILCHHISISYFEPLYVLHPSGVKDEFVGLIWQEMLRSLGTKFGTWIARKLGLHKPQQRQENWLAETLDE